MITATVRPAQSEANAAPPPPPMINTCPSCQHWLQDGTLSCPDCQALTYGQHLGALAADAQSLEAQQKFTEARDRWQTALTFLPPETRQAEGIRQRIAVIDQHSSAAADQKARWTKRLGPFAPIGLFLLKAKSFFFVLLKLKFLLSFLFTFGIYALFLGPWGSLVFILGLLIHEMGHYIAVKRRGLQADLPVFVPGFGAYVRWYGMGVSREDLAAISLAGPLFGLIAALLCWALYAKTRSPIVLVLANLTAWYNLLNLAPVFGLDGAKVVLALSKLQRAMVAVTCVVLFALMSARDPFELHNISNHYILLVLAALMGYQCFSNQAPEEPHSQTMIWTAAVIVSLSLVMHMTALGMALIPQLQR